MYRMDQNGRRLHICHSFVRLPHSSAMCNCESKVHRTAGWRDPPRDSATPHSKLELYDVHSDVHYLHIHHTRIYRPPVCRDVPWNKCIEASKTLGFPWQNHISKRTLTIQNSKPSLLQGHLCLIYPNSFLWAGPSEQDGRMRTRIPRRSSNVI